MSVATFTTSMGTFKAELYTDKMPITWYVNATIEECLISYVGCNDFMVVRVFRQQEYAWKFISTNGHLFCFQIG